MPYSFTCKCFYHRLRTASLQFFTTGGVVIDNFSFACRLTTLSLKDDLKVSQKSAGNNVLSLTSYIRTVLLSCTSLHPPSSGSLSLAIHILFPSTTPSPPYNHLPPPLPIVPPIPNLLLPQFNNFASRSAQLLLLFSPFFPCLAVSFLPLLACKLPSMAGPRIPTSIFTFQFDPYCLLLSLQFSVFP